LLALSVPAHARHGFNMITADDVTPQIIKRPKGTGCTNSCEPVKPTGGK
jgi:hypothetical protein